MFSTEIGIDLGTANTLVTVKNKGIVVNEPSVVAINSVKEHVLAVGNEAKVMIGRTPGNIVAIRPIKDGVIAKFEVTKAMLKHFIKKAVNNSIWIKPRVVICVPSGITEVEKRAVVESTLQAGARDVYLIEEPMAAAIGANLPIAEPNGSMVVDIGGGTSEVAVISLGGIVTSKSLRVAGDEFDSSIILHIKKQYNLSIGEITAEEIKIAIGSAYKLEQEKTMDICGRDLVTGLPKNIKITSEEIREALREPIIAIVEAIKFTLEKTPPELSADIISKGIVLTGGGALMPGLSRLIEDETGLNVIISENPKECVVIGTGMVLNEINKLKGILFAMHK